MKISMREKRFPSASGVCDIRYRLWVPEEPRAALQIIHGMAEHIDRYDDFARFLSENGILVFGCDLAGQGKSVRDGEPLGWFGNQNGWDALIQDMRILRDIVKDEFPAISFTLMGHSMGSFLARSYAGRDGDDFDAFIFSGTAGMNPVLGVGKLIAKSEIKRKGGKLPSQLLYDLSFGSYNKSFKPARTESDWLSRDEAQVDRYVADEKCGYAFSASAMLAVFEGIGEISGKKWARQVPKRPVLIFSGALDPVGNAGRGVKQVASWLRAEGHAVELKLYEGARHEMLNETNRDEVYQDVLLFINAVEAMGDRE